MNNLQILEKMDRDGQYMAHKVGIGIIKNVIDGKAVECKTRLNRGTSGKLFTTIWYVDGKRTARAKVLA